MLSLKTTTWSPFTVFSSEAEYRALSDALNEVVWIVMLLREIGIEVTTPIEFKEDNEATIKLG